MSSIPQKRPFNLLLNEKVVREAREHTGNLSATVEALLIEFVTRQEDVRLLKQQLGAAVAGAWNQFNEVQGSFADEWNTLCWLNLMYLEILANSAS